MTVEPPTNCFPKSVGQPLEIATLCIGLDIAWYGGSKGKPDTQNDCLISAVFNPQSAGMQLQFARVKLSHRDESAAQIFDAIQRVVEQHGTGVRVVLALDAPLQTNRTIPVGRIKARRSCEDVLSKGRMRIDEAAGGARGWHPNIQPGAPLAPRVQKLLALLHQQLGFETWTEGSADASRLVIECFPAEAIWAAKRMGCYARHLTSDQVKAYKKQQGKRLSSDDVAVLTNRVLLDGFSALSSVPLHWPNLVEALIGQMLALEDWQKEGTYMGGKFLDDAVDSAICFATALSYANGNAHLWHDMANPGDGHIIGPGVTKGFLTGRTQLI
tara:strand:+ start:3056 stop:4039 length:984 start_codon:yes stop_codon:yes gene_type:complete